MLIEKFTILHLAGSLNIKHMQYKSDICIKALNDVEMLITGSMNLQVNHISEVQTRSNISSFQTQILIDTIQLSYFAMTNHIFCRIINLL